MKLLHIGKHGNIERFTTNTDFIKQLDIIDLPANLTETAYLEKAKDADFIVADAMATVSGELISNMPNLKLIHSEGVGYNFFDTITAGERGIYVCNCKGMNDKAVAEQAILLMLSMLRDVNNGNAAVLSGNQIKVKESYMKRGDLLELSDCKVGLIGFGDIARALANLLNSFGAQTYYNKKNPVDAQIEKEYGVTYLPLAKLLQTCDIISLHAPVTKETTNMVNHAFIEKMKPGAYLVNTARGELVDSDALIDALKNGKIKMAGLDTIAGEPVSQDNKLVNLPQEIQSKIIFSPHIGGITASSFKRGYSIIWSNIQKICEGKEPEHIVNR